MGEQFRTAVDASPQLFVFWCIHSSKSAEVLREYSYALDKGKRVVPVLLDGTVLPELLARIHGIDLRAVVQHQDPRPPGSHGGMAELTDAQEIERSREPDLLTAENYLRFDFSRVMVEGQQVLQEATARLASEFSPFFH